MAEIKPTVVVLDASITLTLNEQEARALNAIAGYGIKPFLEVFYDKMGKHYLKPHEEGLKSLFEAARNKLPSHYYDVDRARQILKDSLKK